MRLLIGLIFLFCCLGNLLAQGEESTFLGTTTKISNPLKLRDPFAPPRIEKIREENTKKREDEGYFTNIDSVGKLSLTSISLLGVVVGPQKMAIVSKKGGGGTALLKVGDTVNGGNATLKEILGNSVIFVEKIMNIYGQEEYLETVIPISE